MQNYRESNRQPSGLPKVLDHISMTKNEKGETLFFKNFNCILRRSLDWTVMQNIKTYNNKIRKRCYYNKIICSENINNTVREKCFHVV